MTNEHPQIPAEFRALMAEIGPHWSPGLHVKLMVEQFSEVLNASPKGGMIIRRNIAYGDHPRQMFDVYLPNDGRTSRAAVLFVHGGAFLDGHRNRSDQIFSNVTTYFARRGVVGINIGYRLADETGYPGATQDNGRVVQWTHAHAAEIGVDPSRIFLMGHSAGAAHAGSYAYDKRLQPAGGLAIAGLLVISGRVRAENLPENPNGLRSSPITALRIPSG